MPKQKPHILLLSVGLVLLFGFTACVMAKTYIAYSKQLNRMAVIGRVLPFPHDGAD